MRGQLRQRRSAGAALDVGHWYERRHGEHVGRLEVVSAGGGGGRRAALAAVLATIAQLQLVDVVHDVDVFAQRRFTAELKAAKPARLKVETRQQLYQLVV